MDPNLEHIMNLTKKPNDLFDLPSQVDTSADVRELMNKELAAYNAKEPDFIKPLTLASTGTLEHSGVEKLSDLKMDTTGKLVKAVPRSAASLMPANWTVNVNDEDGIDAVNAITGEIFHGSIKEFNKFMRGE
jgi:hypothetical protein